MRACIESLTKGPAIQASDKDSLQRYADTAQVTYDTLESMGYLSEMNADNLEKARSLHGYPGGCRPNLLSI